MNIITDPDKCTGCSICSITCPHRAVVMEEDKYGFKYPRINQDKCIHCQKCVKACPENKESQSKNAIQCYAAQGNSIHILLNSASGGAFYFIAKNFIDMGGVVYGCNMSIKSGDAVILHKRIYQVERLSDIIGSKYAQSESYQCFMNIQEDLISGKRILFASTPCQVMALKSYLGKEYENLFTIDIFCHGNTNVKLLSDYFRYLGKLEKSNISRYVFRDKERGKGYKPKYLTSNSNRWHKLATYQQAYWYLFQKSKILRRSCYKCRYTSSNRVGDISLGDFWGIEKTRPDIYYKFNTNFGISAVIINSKKGISLFENVPDLKSITCNLEDISKYGDAICKPAEIPNDRESILENYVNRGYEFIQAQYRKSMGLTYYKYIVREFPIIERILSMLRS